MKIEPGFYRTRDGRKAEVISTTAIGHPLVGKLDSATCSWCADGKFVSYKEDENDLIAPWEEPVVKKQKRREVWMNQHDSFMNLFAFSSRESAERQCGPTRTHSVHFREVLPGDRTVKPITKEMLKNASGALLRDTIAFNYFIKELERLRGSSIRDR